MLLARNHGALQLPARTKSFVASRYAKCVRGIPQFLIDDAKVRNLRRDQIIGVRFSRHNFSSRGILDVEEAVFEIHADLKLIVNDAALLACAANDGLKIPMRSARRRRNFIAHQISRNLGRFIGPPGQF